MISENLISWWRLSSLRRAWATIQAPNYLCMEGGDVVTILALLPKTSIQSWVASRLGAKIISHSVTESFGDVKVDPVISVGKKL